MKLTENYELKKPDGTDIVNIDDLNYNSDVVDTKLKELSIGKAENSVVSTTANGLMTKEDKVKLNSIAAGANAYVHPSTHPAAMITEDASHRFATDSEKGIWNGKANNVAVSTTANGLMTKEDKVKLDGIAAGANAYVHPSTHSAAIITEDTNHRFATDSEKSTWNGKAANVAASTTANGLMTKEDKVKLNGVAAGANAYVHPSTHPATIITEDTTHRFVTDTEKSTWNGKAASNHNHDNSYASKGELDSIKEQIVQNKPIVITDDYPVGGFMWFTVGSIPTGWLVCNGQGVTTVDYPDLFRVIGYKYGGEGSWFRVPDLITNNRFIRASADSEVGSQKTMYYTSVVGGTETIAANISFLPCIKSKQLAKGMTTVAEEWTNFKENGGDIKNKLTVQRLAVAPTSAYSQWANIELIGGGGTKKANISLDPSGGQLCFLADFGTENLSNQLIMNSSSLYPYGTTKSLGTPSTPWHDLWLGGHSTDKNGYTKLPNGLILQWGNVGGTLDANGKAWSGVTFPIAFPNKCLRVIPSCTWLSGADSGEINVGANSNETNTTVTLHAVSVRGVVSKGISIGYFAIGY